MVGVHSSDLFAPRVEWAVGAELGEGPIWLERAQALLFVDIKGGQIHRFEPSTGNRTSLVVAGTPSFIVPTAQGQLLVGDGHALRLLADGRLGEPLIRIQMAHHNRTNDATVDHRGCLWFGTMDAQERLPTGTVYCLQQGRLRQTDFHAVVTNGPAVTADGRWMYVVDSMARTIWRYGLEGDQRLDRGEVFVTLEEQAGYPDGVATDVEGYLWVALWEGWGLRRYAPDGILDRHIPFPCARVTKVAFGGPDRRSAYVTTARCGLEERGGADQPLAGALFSFRVAVPGTPVPCYQPRVDEGPESC